MSTEIKPGQVWASMHNAAETATVREVRGNEVWATDDQSGAHFVRASLGFRCDYELVKEPPAPLDPSKVKAGDAVMSYDVLDALPVGSVVLEGSSGAVIPGVLPTMPGVFHRFPDGWYVVAGQGARDDIDFPVTVLHVPDHHPATEPEPEWETGTVVKGTVVVDQTHDAVELDHDVQMMRVTHIDTVGRAYVSAGGDIIDPRHVTDVRPLVVIDPAAVDVDNIIKVAKDFWQFHPKAGNPVEAGVREALRRLGIEAP